MTRWWMIFFMMAFVTEPAAQQVPAQTEQQLEKLAEMSEEGSEDDAYIQEAEYFRKHPLNLNIAEREDLERLPILSALQIVNFLRYRQLLGKLISVYELQAVPAWDVYTINRLLPFITIENASSWKDDLRVRSGKGDHSLLFRISQLLEKSKGYQNSATGPVYTGSSQRVLLRYRYTYKNLLQWGMTGDKDAGESFFSKVQRTGFDFYSFHFFARKIGAIQSLALGDFTVNMGQGLIHWQGMAFKKSADITAIRRQSALLRPYNAAGEFFFHRGAGITLKVKNMEGTVFASIRKLSGNKVKDTINGGEYISSFLTSGYHRSLPELLDRKNVTQVCFGGNINYRQGRWHIGINAIACQFSLPLKKRNEPYSLYATYGNKGFNFSMDYSYSWKNLYVFGEAAADKNLHTAFIQGLLISVDPSVDISFIQRTIAAPYQAIHGNSFTENTLPGNETGFFGGISVRPITGWRLDAFADLFKFPWLKYQVDAPSQGSSLLLQLTYSPNKQMEIITRYRNETKQMNQPGNISETNHIVSKPVQNWRTQIHFKLNSAITIRSRTELLWYDPKGLNKETGFSVFTDLLYKPMLKPLSGTFRLQYFETEGYNSRIYAFENDVAYNYTVPALYDKGFRYYLILSLDLTRKLQLETRLAQTIYKEKNGVGTGWDETPGNKRTEVKLQAMWLF